MTDGTESNSGDRRYDEWMKLEESVKKLYVWQLAAPKRDAARIADDQARVAHHSKRVGEVLACEKRQAQALEGIEAALCDLLLIIPLAGRSPE